MTETHITRRRLLTGGAALVGGAALGAGVVASISSADDVSAEEVHGRDQVPFHGAHQSGIETPPQAHTWFVALDLLDRVDRSATARLLRLWTDDAVRLTRGDGALADQERELASEPSRLTITVGVGATLLARLGLEDRRPASLGPLPPFSIDRLEPQWGAADLLVQVGADDLVTVSHAVRVLTRDARSFARIRWVQKGFARSRGTTPAGTTPRNLLGQVDGTVNPVPGTPEFDRAVWAVEGPTWWHGGTMLVLRRTRLELDSWERLGRADREQVIGRRLADGSPLTGGVEQTAVDLTAQDQDGLLVVPELAHVRVARARSADEVFLRRGYTYDDSDGVPGGDAGLIFAAYTADVDRSFLPVQRRIAEADLLTTWATPIGSAVFAILPGCDEGGWLGESLLA